MLGKTKIDGLWLTHANLDLCPYHILTSMGGSKKRQGLTTKEIVIQGNLNKPTNYTTMQAWAVVTHVTSYDVLVEGLVLYPLGITIDFWEETAYYHPGWQTRVNHKASLLVKFIRGGASRNFLKVNYVG
jgi:hypothetical protein